MKSQTAARPTSMWTPLDGYQSATSTQGRADAARDAQEEAVDLLTENEWEEFWRMHTEDLQ